MTSDDKIVDLTRADGAADPDRARIEAHWRDIGGSRDIPARVDIDPAAIAPCLDRMILIERIAPRQARIRLAGQRITTQMGLDLRGMPLLSLMTPPSRDWLGDAIVALFDEPARIELGLAGPRSAFRSRSRASLLLLPLRDREGALTRGLGFMSLPEKGQQMPARFDICGEARRPLQCGARLPTQAATTPPETRVLEEADRARDVLRRRQSFHVVS